MKNAPNEIVALEWLAPQWLAQLTALYELWQAAEGDTRSFERMAQSFDELAASFSLASLPDFVRLSEDAGQLCAALAEEEVLPECADALAGVIRLLQHLLHRRGIADIHQKRLIALKRLRIAEILGEPVALTEAESLSVLVHPLLPQKMAMTEEAQDRGALVETWQKLVADIGQSEENTAWHAELPKTATALADAMENDAARSLWQLAALWLTDASEGELIAADTAKILQRLSEQLDDLDNELLQEDTLLDVYLRLSNQPQHSELASHLLSALSAGAPPAKSFFAAALQSLEMLLFKLEGGEVLDKDALKHLQQRFAYRGWTFFEAYIAQILEDAEAGQEVWQLSAQLQDLYTSIQRTHNTIAEKIVKKDANNHPEGALFLLGDVEAQFDTYLHTTDIHELPDGAQLDDLAELFEEVGADSTAVARLVAFITKLRKMAPTRLGQQFGNLATQGVAYIDAFVDSLAVGVMDESLLLRSMECIDEADVLMGAEVSDEELVGFVAPQLGAPRYDDSGEVDAAPAVMLTEEALDSDSAQAEQDVIAQDDLDVIINSQPELTEGVSEAYQKIVSDLPTDVFDHDEDIRDIFIEEAEEVLAEISPLLPVWQARPTDLKPLTDIRRGFHTLKGSGRMVGAFSVGEMAWSVENLLNRVLDGKVVANGEIASFVVEVANKVPVLVQDFQEKHAASEDVASIILKANNLLAGKPIEEGVPSVSGLSAVTQDAVSPEKVEIETEIEAVQLSAAAPSAALNTVSGGDKPASIAEHSLQVEELVLPEVLDLYMEKACQPIFPAITGVDEDIREIFIEEADEVLGTMAPDFVAWQRNRRDMALLTEVRRGFHTLKGSGRMVGADEIAELAWSIEHMLNRVLNNIVIMNAGMMTLISDVIASLPALVERFKVKNKTYPEEMKLWMACAHAYSEGHGEEFDYRTFSHFASRLGVKSLDAELAEQWQANEEIQLRPEVEALGGIHEAEEIIFNAPLVSPVDEEEEELCAIFIEEARELLLEIKTFLAEHQSSSSVAVSDEIVRAFHTLRGASGLPPLVAIAEMSAQIEKSLQGLQQHENTMNAAHMDALKSSVQLIESHLDAYEAKLAGEEVTALNQELLEEKQLFEHMLSKENITPDAMPFNTAELIDGIDALLDADIVLASADALKVEEIELFALEVLPCIETLKSRTQRSTKFQRLLTAMTGGYRALVAYPEQLYVPEFVDCLLACQEDLTQLFDAIAGSMSLRLSRSPEFLEEMVAEMIARGGSTHEPLAVVEQAPVDPPVYEVVETDPDLLEIFLMEVQSVDEMMVQSFEVWQEEIDNVEIIKGLQRHTQTVKGGARLAAIDSIYVLMDKADSAYQRLLDGTFQPTADWVRVLHGVLDLLSLQITELKNHARSFYAFGSFDQLDQYVDDGVPEGAYLTLPSLESTDIVEQAPVEVVALDNLNVKNFASYREQSWQDGVPDADILAVFLEEADELVESGAEDFQAFRANTSDVAALQSLQRNLHTIKGGARMVDANGIADLAHEMETVYEDLGARRRPVTRNITTLLLACQDWIANAIRLLKHQVNPPTPTPLIEALINFSADPDSLDQIPQVSLESELMSAEAYEVHQRQQKGMRDITQLPPMKGTFVQTEEAAASGEMIRIPSALMERMINLTGEASINRTRIDMSMVGLTTSIEEMGTTIQRLADQLRRMDVELEAQILAQIDDKHLLDENFDPLEMDQYSSLNQLSKSLAESASDLLDLKATLLEKTRDGENLLLQLSRTQAEIQDGLMSSRMLPFSRLTPRFQRLVRQVAPELGKQVELTMVNADDEMDKTILERITSPLEHMLRNAIDHGIEMPEHREMMGKSRTGQISLEVVREGNEVVIHLSDDGAGINVEAVRKKAIAQGLISVQDDTLTDLDIMQYIFNAGFTTTNAITQISGRGVGMDVVRSEIRQLGGTVSVTSTRGQGSRFTLRVPLTVAMSDALVVRVADRHYAIPLTQIDRIAQADPEALIEYYQSAKGAFEMAGVEYRLRYLNELLLGHNFAELLSANDHVPVIIVKNQTGQNLAVQVDEIIGSRLEVVVKPLGRQLSHVAGISAATITGDGSVMLILDLMALIRNAQARVAVVIEQPKQEDKRPLIMVVDDSVTVRKVTSRFLERQGFDVIAAKDGVDAMEMLQEVTPDVMLLDIEMPRMDGFEVAAQVRRNARLQHLPIIMITSRTGEKHRERALELGVNDYMGKPFQENELFARIEMLLARGQRV